MTPEILKDLRAIYGEEACFSEVGERGQFLLVHLDHPNAHVLEQRIREFDPQEFFVDDCPLCEASKAQGGHIVFNGLED